MIRNASGTAGAICNPSGNRHSKTVLWWSQVRPVNDKAGDERADTQEELLQRGEPTADRRVGDLGLIQRREQRKHADADTGKEATRHHHALVLSSSLKHTTENEHESTHDDGEAARKGIRDQRSGDAADKRSEQHGADDEADVVRTGILGDAHKVGCHDDTGNDTEIC